MNTFCVSINGGPVRTVTLASDIYQHAVAAALVHATERDVEGGNIEVKIWVPELLPDYGPYVYQVATNLYGNLEIG